jgi:hypothetical protein
VDALCHTREEIERLVLRLPCVPTDNRDALLELGFERMYPQVASGYESRLWMRSVDSGYAGPSKGRKFIVQRAYLDGPSINRRSHHRQRPSDHPTTSALSKERRA